MLMPHPKHFAHLRALCAFACTSFAPFAHLRTFALKPFASWGARQPSGSTAPLLTLRLKVRCWYEC